MSQTNTPIPTCGLCKSLAPEILSFVDSLYSSGERLAPSALFPSLPADSPWICRVESSLWQRLLQTLILRSCRHFTWRSLYPAPLFLSCMLRGGGGGQLPLWRWRGCKAPKTPYFQRCCHPVTPYFCWLSLLSPKDPTIFCEMWVL